MTYIGRQAKANKPFFLYIGWSQVHYPGLPHPDFEGKSGAGPYGDCVMELDYRTGQVLDAVKKAGIEDNTIVIWLSDNGPARSRRSTPTTWAVHPVHFGVRLAMHWKGP